MPLVKLKPLLEEARKNKYCLGCFNVFNTETLEGVIKAATIMRTPIILAIYEPHFKYSDIEAFSSLVKKLSYKVNIPIVLHLEYARKISSIIKAIQCGFTSLMYEGPEGIGFEEKINKTKMVAEIAHSVGLTVEAELGYTAKNSNHKKIVNPEDAEEFVKRTGIDILSPDIGFVHGLKEQKASLNLNVLTEIKRRTNCYLSLHGGSGVDDSIIREAIKIGINKASVFTRISNHAVQKLKTLIEKGSTDLPLLMNEVRNGFTEMVKDRLEVFGSKNILKSICIDFNESQLSEVLSKQKNYSTTNLNYLETMENYNKMVDNLTTIIIEKIEKYKHKS